MPQFFGNFIAGRGLQIGGVRIQPLQRHAQTQIGALIADKPFGFVGDRFQDLHAAWRVQAVPDDIAAHFDQRGGQRIKEPPTRQGQLDRLCGAGLACGIGDGIGHRHRQVGKHMFGQIINQGGLDICAVAPYGQRQVENNRIGGFWGDFQAEFARRGSQIKADADLTFGDAVIIGGGEFLFETSVRLAADFGCRNNRWGCVGYGHNLPFASARAVDGQGAGFGDDKILRGFGCTGGIGAARYGFRQDQCARLAIKPDLQAGACGQGQRLGGLIIQIQGGFAGVGGRLRPAFPSGARGSDSRATRS